MPFLYGPDHYPGAARLVAAGAVGLLLIGAAFVPRRALASGEPVKRLWLLGFGCVTAHFVLVYTLPSTGIPWPLGILVAVAPIVAGLVVVRRHPFDAYGPDGLRLVSGMLWFFVFLDALVGLGGRYDLTVGAIVLALGLRWLRRRPARLAVS